MSKDLDNLNAYELMMILRSSSESEKQKETVEEVKKYFSSCGKIKETKDLGKKTFSYPIRKEKEGNYWFFVLEMPGEEAKKLAERFKHNEIILRHLLIRR